MKSRVEHYVEEHEDMVAKKNVWRPIWQLTAEYVHTIKSIFDSDSSGYFLWKNVFDTHAGKSNVRRASSLTGELWPAGAASVKLRPVKKLRNTFAVKRYFEQSEERRIALMNDPEAGLEVAMQEFYLDDGCFGTQALLVLEGAQSPLEYRMKGIRRLFIKEDARGKVNIIHLLEERTLEQVVEEYGMDSLDQNQQELLKKRPTDKIKILTRIGPRKVRSSEGIGNLNMPIESVHINMKGKKIIKESGFNEFPAMVGRSIKVNGETYGRSAAMMALPEILLLNAVKEAQIRAMEKNLNPPLAVLDDNVLGRGILDRSAGATNVLKLSQRPNEKVIQPLFTIGDMSGAEKAIEDLKQSVSEHFSIDKLLDFNNQVQMTLGEAQIRNQMRGKSLGSIYARQIQEVYNPMIERSVSILFRKGHLGVINGSMEQRLLMAMGEDPIVVPDEVAELILTGQDFYEIEYDTPAARVIKSERLGGIFQTLEFTQGVANIDPTAALRLNLDEAVRRVSELTGAPSEVIRDDQTVQQLTQAIQQQQQQQVDVETENVQADTAQKASKAQQA